MGVTVTTIPPDKRYDGTSNEEWSNELKLFTIVRCLNSSLQSVISYYDQYLEVTELEIFFLNLSTTCNQKVCPLLRPSDDPSISAPKTSSFLAVLYSESCDAIVR